MPGIVVTDPSGNAYAAPAPNRNLLIGGDFGTNPWQRGTSFSGIGSTAAYTADRWAVRGDSTSVSQQADAPVGAAYSIRLQRPSGSSSTTSIQLYQVIESANCYQAQGQQVTLSFYAKCGANFSASGSNLSVILATGTQADEGLSGLVGASWTGYAAQINASQQIGTTFARYSLSALIPSSAEEIGVVISATPSGTAGTNDWFEIALAQLEVGPTATEFENKSTALVRQECQRFFASSYNDGAAPGTTTGAGSIATLSADETFIFGIQFPAKMRTNPTVTFYSPVTGASGYAAGLYGASGDLSVEAAKNPGQSGVATYAVGTVTESAGYVVHYTADAEL